MDFITYVKPELLVLVIALYGLGLMLKASSIKDKFIPASLGVTGVVLSMLYVVGVEGLNFLSVFTSIVQGILVAAGAVFTNELIKQSKR